MNGPIADNSALAVLFSKDPRTRQIETDFLRRLDGWICSRRDDSEVLLSLLDLLNHLAPTATASDADPPRRRFNERSCKDSDPTT